MIGLQVRLRVPAVRLLVRTRRDTCIVPVTVAMILGRVGLDIEKLLRLRVLLMTVRLTQNVQFCYSPPSL